MFFRSCLAGCLKPDVRGGDFMDLRLCSIQEAVKSKGVEKERRKESSEENTWSNQQACSLSWTEDRHTTATCRQQFKTCALLYVFFSQSDAQRPHSLNCTLDYFIIIASVIFLFCHLLFLHCYNIFQF